MSDAKAEARQRAVDYLTRLLQMNPVQAGDAIIAARSEALGLAKNVKAAELPHAEAQRADRRALLDQLETLRTQFWTMPIDVLQQQVAGLDGAGFADVEAAIARLRVVADHRPRFVSLVQKEGFDGELFSSLKEVLTRSLRDTAVVRERVLSTFRDRKKRKRGRKMIALLKAEMPAIYELEGDWFNTLERQKAMSLTIKLTTRSGSNAVGTGSAASARSYWWAGLVVMAILRAIFSYSDASRSNHTSAPRIPTRSYGVPQSVPAPQYDYNQRNPSGAPSAPFGSSSLFRPGGARSQMDQSTEDSTFGGDKNVWRPYQSPNEPPDPSPRVPRGGAPGGSMAPFATPRVVPIPGSPLNGQPPR